MKILDDRNYVSQRDPDGALDIALAEPDQLRFAARVEQYTATPKQPAQVVVAGMGGSALGPDIAKAWLDLPVPFEIVRRYTLPAYVGPETLVIASSYSGNTEETIEALEDAKKRGARIAIIAAAGILLETAKSEDYPYVQIAAGLQPRMAVLYSLKGITTLLETICGLASGKVQEIEQTADWLASEVGQWAQAVPFEQNVAKQLAEQCVGKTPVVYGGSLIAPIARKWKIGFNENAKNTAFSYELPEFNHNEFIGWSSHPIEKPFAVIDLVSNFEHPRTVKRFEVSDRLLSGTRPKAIRIDLKGDTPLQQMLWAVVLGDFVSIYVALLNGVNPTPVDLGRSSRLS